MGEKKKKGKKKNETSGSTRKDEWVGKHKVLVNTYLPAGVFASKIVVVSEFVVLDLKEDIIEMKHPYKLCCDGYLGSAALVLENTIVAYQIGGRYEEIFNAITRDSIDDHIHSFRGTSKCVLNLKTNPPKWSKWRDCVVETTSYSHIPLCVTLGNKIFGFGGTTPIGQVYHTNKIGGAKWEDLPIPSGRPDLGDSNFWFPARSHVLSDPKNNRLIFYFHNSSCLYAYYPDKDEESRWECLNNNMETYRGFTGQVFDNVIYLFDPPYTIHAYDVRQRIWLNVSWRRKKLEDCDMSFREMSSMIHLGDGMMCLADHCSPPISPHRSLQLFRFHVRRVSDKDVRLYPASYHSFDVGCFSVFSYAPF